ncbi:MAG TPA: DUF11 domain-containing protein [Pirellulales bacterium]|nr:DUF11 domain-containing protein [Pirellulales bacterium]
MPWHPWCVVALATLILSSCRAPLSLNPWKAGKAKTPPDALPATAYTGVPPGFPISPSPGLPLPYNVAGPWSPPGIARPWPPMEYLRDGGDRGAPVAVSPNWEVYGLDLEDTVAHYDTLDGHTMVQPSNEVHVYAPRFGAVRVVSRIAANEQIHQAIGVDVPEGLARQQRVAVPTTTLQRLQARGELGTRIASAYRSRQGDGALSSSLTAKGFQDTFLPFEDLTAIRNGGYDQAEKARLAEGVQAALAWSHDQAVQVTLNHQAAVAYTQNERTEEVFTVKDLRDSPRLRLIKVASTQTAEPGDTIDFTLRFDNVGDQALGNIVLVDNLTTRLEYVPDSAQSSVESQFSTELNEADSLVLRWEIDEPLEPGQGGIVRFRCKVR